MAAAAAAVLAIVVAFKAETFVLILLLLVVPRQRIAASPAPAPPPVATRDGSSLVSLAVVAAAGATVVRPPLIILLLLLRAARSTSRRDGSTIIVSLLWYSHVLVPWVGRYNSSPSRALVFYLFGIRARSFCLLSLCCFRSWASFGLPCERNPGYSIGSLICYYDDTVLIENANFFPTLAINQHIHLVSCRGVK